MMGHVNNVDVGVGISHTTTAIVKSDALFQPNLSPKTFQVVLCVVALQHTTLKSNTIPGTVCCCYATHCSVSAMPKS